MFGISGGVLLVPALVLIAGLGQRVAHATSLAAVLPISLAAGTTYIFAGYFDPWAALALAASPVPGTVLGTRILERTRDATLRYVFAGLTALTAVRLFLFLDVAKDFIEPTPAMIAGLVAAGVATGVFSSILGVGGGIFVVPFLMLALSLDAVVARGTSLLMVIPVAMIATLRGRRTGNVEVRTAAIVGLSGTVCAVVGAELSSVLDPRISNGLFAVLLLVIGAQPLLAGRRKDARTSRSNRELGSSPLD